MKNFREAKLQYLVSTDIAARGIDVEGITHIFNYDIPEDPDSYIHRIGRTARAGQSGVAVTFVTPKNVEELHAIERKIKMDIKKSEKEGTAKPKAKPRFNSDREERDEKGYRPNRFSKPSKSKYDSRNKGKGKLRKNKSNNRGR